jgi:nicotinamide riboside kinase
MPSNTTPANIYIIGPQSTGKTTLVNKLRSEPNHWRHKLPIAEPQIISEVARSVLSEHEFTADDITSSQQRCLTLQRLILEAQVQAENKALEKSNWFISDRSGIDPLVYARRYASAQGAVELQQLDVWIQAKARIKDSLIVVCESGTPWLADDGVRLMPQNEEEWLQLFQEFCAVLDDLGLQYSVVPKTMLDLSERAEFVRRNWAERCGS